MIKTRSRAALMAAALLITFISGCKKDKHLAIIGKCPEVIATTPGDGEQNVPVNKNITATFNEKMDPGTFTQESFKVTGASAIPGKVTYNESDSTLTFAPTTTLSANTSFTAVIASGVKDGMGNSLQKDHIWAFTTGTLMAIIAPTVISTDPSNNANGVLVGKIVAATFSEPMDPASITGQSFLLSQGSNTLAGTVSYSGSTAYFTPSSNLVNGTTYTATVTSAVKNVAGTTMAANYTWMFSTIGATSTPVAPMIISTDPSNNATNVSAGKIVSATFDQQMNPSSISSVSFLVEKGGTSVAGTVSYAGTTASFTPSSNLAPNSTYNATITTFAKNLAGTSIAGNYIWSFQTGAAPTPTIGVDLKTAADFGIIAGVGISNNAGFSVINDMNVGISPGVRTSITGFPPAVVVNGTIFASDDTAPPGVPAMLTQAKQDLTAAYLYAEGASNPAPATVSGDQGGLTLAPGIYKSTSTLLIQSGNLTLDGQGDPNSFWIFQIASAFTSVGGAGGSVILTNGAQAKNVYWQVGSSATIGDNTAFKGNILALTSITMGSNSTAVGRMLVQNGAVTLTNTNIINKP